MNQDEKWYEKVKKAYEESAEIDEHYAEMFMGVSHETDQLFIIKEEDKM